MDFVRPIYIKLKEKGLLNNPFATARTRAQNPYTVMCDLKKLSNNYSDEIKDFVVENMIGRVHGKGMTLKDFAGFGKYTLAMVVAKTKFPSRTDHEFIRMFLTGISREELTRYAHFREMLIGLTGYQDVEGISLSMEAYDILEPIMNEKIMAEILKREPSRKVFAIVVDHPILAKIRDREALNLFLVDYLNYNGISLAKFSEADLEKLTKLFTPWRHIQKAILEEYKKFNKPMAEMLLERLPKPELRVKPDKLGPSNIA